MIFSEQMNCAAFMVYAIVLTELTKKTNSYVLLHEKKTSA
jgi:hypothetical protein